MATFTPASDVEILAKNARYNKFVEHIESKIFAAATAGLTSITLNKDPYTWWAATPDYINEQHNVPIELREIMHAEYIAGQKIIAELEKAGYSVIPHGVHNFKLEISWKQA